MFAFAVRDTFRVWVPLNADASKSGPFDCTPKNSFPLFEDVPRARPSVEDSTVRTVKDVDARVSRLSPS